MLRESLEINRKLLGERHPSYLWILNSLVQALLAQDKLKEAEALARQGLAIQNEILGADHPLLAISMTCLARVLEEEGRTPEAKTNLDQALLIWRKRLSNQDPSMGETVSALIDILLTKGDYPQAKQVFDQVSAPQALGKPNKTVLFVCGNYLARTGNFKSAADHFQKVVQLDPGNHQAYQALAALYFQLGDLQAYRQFCNQILATFGTVTNDPRIADRMAKSCLISPPPDPKDFAAVTNLAQIAVTFDANAANNPWFQFCKGFAEYRAGNFAGARAWMRKVLERVKDGSTRDVGAYMILAMAEQGLRRPEAAHDAFDKGTKLAATRLRSLAHGDIESGWADWILAHALIREAEKVTGREAEETTSPVTVAAP
jgi:tetratricopeptide (TPR) repeat protein